MILENSSQVENLQIRLYTSEDYEDILEIWQMSHIRPFLPDQLERLDTAKGQALVATISEKIEEKIVGVLIWAQNGQTGNLWRLAVHPDYRRRGIAKALLAQSEIAMKNAGLEGIRLMLRTQNQNARDLYLQNGWKHQEGIEVWAKKLN